VAIIALEGELAPVEARDFGRRRQTGLRPTIASTLILTGALTAASCFFVIDFGRKVLVALFLERASLLVVVARRSAARLRSGASLPHRLVVYLSRAFHAVFAENVVPVLAVSHWNFSASFAIATGSRRARRHRSSSAAWRMPSSSAWAKI